jgi:hypothetical protein
MAAEPDSGIGKKMLPLYIREAESYSLAVESEPKKQLALKKELIFEWLNPARDKGQQGNVFLWLRDGRPAALACIFSHPHDKLPGRKIVHELHALERRLASLPPYSREGNRGRRESDRPLSADAECVVGRADSRGRGEVTCRALHC